MKTPLIYGSRAAHRHSERGVTMVLVALAMVAIIAMAALSIDVITLYLAKQEAQRSADAAALSAAKVISLSGITGDPVDSTDNWILICGPDDGTNGLATRVAKAVANQNWIGGGPVTTPTVTYGPTKNPDCTALTTTGFGVNPIVTVQLTRSSLPTFFSRIWGKTGNTISATATAEVFNPSNSGNSGNQITGTLIPVQPRCVKPWVVPNQDPLIPSGSPFCSQGGGPCQKIINLTDGSINNKGISFNGTLSGIIGETFWLAADCDYTDQRTCSLLHVPPKANGGSGGRGGQHVPPMPNLFYVPGQVGITPVTAVPSCTEGDPFETAIEGCDAPTNYTCGLPPGSGGTNAVDLSRNPDAATLDGVSCLIHQAPGGNIAAPSGQDYLNPFNPVYPVMTPASFPFQILAGSSSPMVVGGGLANGNPISTSPSIVSLPIYDETDPGATLTSGGTTNVTFVGFLQVFVNAVDQWGNVSVTVLNVAGCGNGSGGLPGQPQFGNSPVPVRLITPP